MITYDLCCSLGHGFEGWFASSGEFDIQISAGFVRCPLCNDAAIVKRLTAPNVGKKSNQAQPPTTSDLQAFRPKTEPQRTIIPAPEGMAEMITKLAELQNEILKESRWVGRKFADEARAMHYGEAEPQQIHGESSPQEANALAEEGIAIAALPLPFIPPEAKN